MEQIIAIIFLALLTLAICIFVVMFAFEKYAAYLKRKKIKALESLKRNDTIEIIHPCYEKEALFRSLIGDCMSVVAMKKGIMDKDVIISTSCFVKKLS